MDIRLCFFFLLFSFFFLSLVGDIRIVFLFVINFDGKFGMLLSQLMPMITFLLCFLVVCFVLCLVRHWFSLLFCVFVVVMTP